MIPFRALRPFLFALDAETAHRTTLAALRLAPKSAEPPPVDLRTSVARLELTNPVGLAAGFDKGAEVPDALLRLGFGFVEVGTVTPLPQPGNPKPRAFRLIEDEGIINRYGFNSEGHQRVRERLLRRRRRGVVGVNVGANKESPDRIGDYALGVEAFRDVADYLTVNISSPNTPNLRALQGDALPELLAAVAERRGTVPVFLKVAPDLEPAQVEAIVRATIDARLDGLIVGNTTISRGVLRSRHAAEAGGLSGRPLGPLALRTLKQFRAVAGATLPLIAAGGIDSADEAWARIKAGASAVQLYTALVFAGPALVREITQGLAERVVREGFASVAEAVGTG